MPFNRACSILRAQSIARQLKEAGMDRRPLNLPILYLPGILGSKLFDRQTKKTIWGNHHGLFTPSHYEYDPAAQTLLATEPLHAFSLIPGLVDTLVTAELKDVLQIALGYRENQDLFFLAHDWRADLRQVADLLDAEVTRLTHRFGSQQPFVIIAQSSSNLAVRYWLRSITQEKRKRIAKWYAFGSPWAGTFHALSMMETGYYALGKRFYGFSPEDIASCPSAYQLLPSTPNVIDAYGQPLPDFDIYNAECWQHYKMGPYRSSVTTVSDKIQRLRHNLPNWLDNARDFTAHIAGIAHDEQSVPQVWYLSDNHRAVKTAIYARNRWYLQAKSIKETFPQFAASALAIGDDHLPLESLLPSRCGAIVRDPTLHPWGENFIYISQARTHRALINHTPNLRSLTFDLATIRALFSPSGR